MSSDGEGCGVDKVKGIVLLAHYSVLHVNTTRSRIMKKQVTLLMGVLFL